MFARQTLLFGVAQCFEPLPQFLPERRTIVKLKSRQLRVESSTEFSDDIGSHLRNIRLLEDIAREIEFVAGVREGFEQLNRGESVPFGGSR